MLESVLHHESSFFRPTPFIRWDGNERRNLLVARSAGGAGMVAPSISGTARTIVLPIQHRLMNDDEVEAVEPRLRTASTAVFDIRGRAVALLDIDYFLGAMSRQQ